MQNNRFLKILVGFAIFLIAVLILLRWLPMISTISSMQLSSSAFLHNELVPGQYTCDAENVNPPLSINEAPPDAKSLALIVNDTDVPNGGWTHWVVWNISPATTSIGEAIVPSGAVEGITSFGKPGYSGPCPPSGVHHYEFKLYALDTLLSLPPSSDKGVLEQAMRDHVLAQTVLVATYQRQ